VGLISRSCDSGLQDTMEKLTYREGCVEGVWRLHPTPGPSNLTAQKNLSFETENSSRVLHRF
jgi:hypothetical protein